MTSGSYREYSYYHHGPTDKTNAPLLAKKIINELKKVKNTKKICELGCGNGYLADRLATAGFEVVGIDLSASGIKQAIDHHGSRVRFLCADINQDLATSQNLGGFDAVLSEEVIEHLYRPSDLFEAARPLLKPGGYVLVTTPFHGYLKNLAISIAGRHDMHFDPLWDGGHIKFFSIKTLRQLAQKHGFRVVRFSFYGRIPWLAKSMICLAQKLP